MFTQKFIGSNKISDQSSSLPNHPNSIEIASGYLNGDDFNRDPQELYDYYYGLTRAFQLVANEHERIFLNFWQVWVTSPLSIESIELVSSVINTSYIAMLNARQSRFYYAARADFYANQLFQRQESPGQQTHSSLRLFEKAKQPQHFTFSTAHIKHSATKNGSSVDAVDNTSDAPPVPPSVRRNLG